MDIYSFSSYRPSFVEAFEDRPISVQRAYAATSADFQQTQIDDRLELHSKGVALLVYLLDGFLNVLTCIPRIS